MAHISVWQLAVWRNLHAPRTGPLFGRFVFKITFGCILSAFVSYVKGRPRPLGQKGRRLSDFSGIQTFSGVGAPQRMNNFFRGIFCIKKKYLTYIDSR